MPNVVGKSSYLRKVECNTRNCTVRRCEEHVFQYNKYICINGPISGSR